MKKLLFAIALLTSINCFSQKADSTSKDTLTILNYTTETQQLIYYMQQQASGNVDVKPAIWNQLIQLLLNKTQIVQVPKKEQPKK